MVRRRRAIRAVEFNAKPTVDVVSPEEPSDLPDSCSVLASLGGDAPRRVDIHGSNDIPNQESILVDFLSQDFKDDDVSEYQITFIDDYTSLQRLLVSAFGRGFAPDVYHFKDAPFVRRTCEGIPRTLTAVEKSVLEQHGSFTLPGSEVSDAFITAFFDRVHPTMPIIDRSTFLKHYSGIMDGPKRPSLLLVQSILLSGSTVFCHPKIITPPDEVSRRLHARAKALIDMRTEQDRFTLMQAHLLFSSYTADSCDDTIHNMWLSLGTAVRIAQGLGLHRDLGKAKVKDSVRRQWRKTWWTLFVHDTICSFEWGRPRAVHLPDTDVPLLTESDFRPDEPGALSSVEHVQFFLSLCRLCLLMVEWLDMLRPGRAVWGRDNSTVHKEHIRSSLDLWLTQLPNAMRAPQAFTGFSLWTGTLHIAYQAFRLRFYASTSVAGMAREAANNISRICQDLMHSDLLGSLWGFGIHQLHLAMGHHARESCHGDPQISSRALEKLRCGIPMMRLLCKRSSTAAQGLVFYEALLEKRGAYVVSTAQTSSPSSGNSEEGLGHNDMYNRSGEPWMADHGFSTDLLADMGFLDWSAQWTSEAHGTSSR